MDWFKEVSRVLSGGFVKATDGIINEAQKAVNSEVRKLIRDTAISIRDATDLGHTKAKNNKVQPRPKTLRKRRSIPLSVRHDVFVKANYTCQYCGAKAPTARLEVDHIIPVSKGGLIISRTYNGSVLTVIVEKVIN